MSKTHCGGYECGIGDTCSLEDCNCTCDRCGEERGAQIRARAFVPTARKWPQTLVEKEPTGLHGTHYQWTVDVRPDAALPVIIVEDIVDDPSRGMDTVLVDLDTAKWIHARLGEAIAELEQKGQGTP